MDEIKKHLSNCITASHWNEIGIYPHHGIVLGLFSLRSKNSYGMGEFTDLYPLIDWCDQVGLDTIQLLPLNETSNDSSPYNALSSCALDPMYIGIAELLENDSSKLLHEDLKALKELNNTPRIKYEKLKKRKYDFLFHYYRQVFERVKKTPPYLTFLKQNIWLEEYALFRVLKDLHDGKRWNQWDKKYRDLSETAITPLLEKYSDRIQFYYFLQYLCFSQMSAVKDYATKKKVLLKGDIPILINADSVDLWRNRSDFDLSHVAGCPPDDNDANGQKWGFPLFNWAKMRKNDFAWWRRRLMVASSCYHMYRVDHAVGFFRIWAILPEAEAMQGHFLPRNPFKWAKQGRELLTMMAQATPMLPIAEDLGVIPRMVPKTLYALGICGIKIFRQEKNIFRMFVPLNKYKPLSVTTLATHDQPVMSEWWKEEKKQAKKLAKFLHIPYRYPMTFEDRLSLLEASHRTSSIFHINLFQEYLALIPSFVSKSPKEERINVAGSFLSQNWTYRFRPTIEEIASNEKLANAMKKITKKKL